MRPRTALSANLAKLSRLLQSQRHHTKLGWKLFHQLQDELRRVCLGQSLLLVGNGCRTRTGSSGFPRRAHWYATPYPFIHPFITWRTSSVRWDKTPRGPLSVRWDRTYEAPL